MKMTKSRFILSKYQPNKKYESIRTKPHKGFQCCGQGVKTDKSQGPII